MALSHAYRDRFRTINRSRSAYLILIDTYGYGAADLGQPEMDPSPTDIAIDWSCSPIPDPQCTFLAEGQRLGADLCFSPPGESGRLQRSSGKCGQLVVGKEVVSGAVGRGAGCNVPLSPCRYALCASAV